MSKEDLYVMLCPHCKKRLMYKVAGIAPTEVLRAKKGILGFSTGPLGTTNPQSDLFRNRQILINYINEEGLKGREYAGSINYEGLPYNGVLMFRIPIAEEEIKMEHVSPEEAKEVKGERMFEILRKNREDKAKVRDIKIPKPKVKGQSVTTEEDKETLRKLFEDELSKHTNIEPPKDFEPEWKKAEDELMRKIEAEEKQKESSESKETKTPKLQKVEEINNESLMEDFEKESGKKAIWQGKETKQFKEWRDNLLRLKSLGV